MKYLLYIVLLLSGFLAKAQNTPLPASNKLREIAVALDSFSNKVPIEKIHIHFDKPYYTLGDTLWMKAYIVDEENILSPLSKILYTDLLDGNDSLIVTLRLPVTAGLAWGTIILSDSSFIAGNYRIRAYTNLMRNWGTDYFFNKTISVNSPSLSFANTLLIAGLTKTGRPLKDSTGISIKFFPEGGELIDDLSSKVAFKAIGTDGLSREVSGSIVDQHNNQVAIFKTEHAGMGTFILQPVAGNTYTAIARFKDGSEKKIPLPKAAPQGYSMAVTQSGDNVLVKITATNNLVNTGEILLVAQANNTIQYTGSKLLTKSSFTAVLPKNRFPEGILQFTLFSADKKPVAERLVFIRLAQRQLNVKVVPEKSDYKQRDKVRLNIEVTNQQGQPAAGVFSLAVTDDGKVPYEEADEKTILSNLLLTADLKGFIEHPNYYFTATDANRQQYLDNLMLTQGWRKFVWTDIIANKLPALTYQPENGMGISGTILNNKGKPSPGAKVHLLASVGEGLLLDTVADAQGRFNFEDLAFAKDVKFNIAATDAKGKKNVTVEMTKNKPFERPLIESYPTEMPGNYSQLIATADTSSQKPVTQNVAKTQSANRVNALKEVEIKDKKATIVEIATKNSANLAGPGNADIVLTFVDIANCGADLGGCLMSKLPNVQITTLPGGRLVARTRGATMQFIIDGQPRGDASSVNPQDIASIEVLRGGGAAALYKGAGEGIIIITTKRGDVDYNKYIDEAEAEKRKNIALKEVEIKDTKANIKQIATKNSANLAGPGNADIVLTFVDIANCGGDLGGCLIGKLPNIQITVESGGRWSARTRQGVAGAKMKFIIDGQRREDASSVNPQDIASIEVLRGGRASALYGLGDDGIIIITTKRGDVDYNKYIEEAQNEKLKTVALKEIVIKDKKQAATIQTIATQNSTNLAGPGNADQVLTFVNLIACQYSLAECLQGRLTNVVVKDGKAFARNFETPMHIIVDGVAGRELSSIMSAEVASVEVLRGGGAASLYGAQGANGVLIITTKRGDVNYDSYTPGYHAVTSNKPALVNYKFQSGYDLRRQFYSPDYDNPATIKARVDLRTTIYWNPNIITDENGKASVEFFNADVTGNYKVITEGLGMDGRLGREVFKYAVK